jgi:4-amino-4-deoxy-L-arabinose transferase-like glycosyltransferase
MIENDDLRSRLRRADPAASLAPLTPDEVTRLLEATTSTAVPTRSGTDRQRRFTVLVAAALVLLAAAGGGWLMTRSTPSTTHPVAAVVNLTSADGARQSCGEPTAPQLASFPDFAFAGTVTSVSDNVVTLSVTRVYKGAKADEVRVRSTGGESEPAAGGGRFEPGKKYLIASYRGLVNDCGYSGAADTPGLRELYDAAF